MLKYAVYAEINPDEWKLIDTVFDSEVALNLAYQWWGKGYTARIQIDHK